MTTIKMKQIVCFAAALLINVALSTGLRAQQLPREEWGAAPVTVLHSGANWTINGKANRVTLNETSLALTIQSGTVRWNLMPSQPGDMLVRSEDRPLSLRLADAKTISIAPYDAAFKTGVKVALSRWQHDGRQLDLDLFLTICLEGSNEEVVFDVVANERDTTLRQLDWPGALDANDVDYTLLSNRRGTLLPRNWPKEYYPIRSITAEGKIAPKSNPI